MTTRHRRDMRRLKQHLTQQQDSAARLLNRALRFIQLMSVINLVLAVILAWDGLDTPAALTVGAAALGLGAVPLLRRFAQAADTDWPNGDGVRL